MKKKQLVVHIKKHLHGVAIESMTYASAIMDSMVGVRNSVYKRTCTYAYVRIRGLYNLHCTGLM